MEAQIHLSHAALSSRFCCTNIDGICQERGGTGELHPIDVNSFLPIIIEAYRLPGKKDQCLA